MWHLQRAHPPGHKDGIVEEILKDFTVLSLLLLSLLLSFSFRTSTAWPFITTTHFCLGIFCHLLHIDGTVGVLSDGYLVFSEKNRAGMKALYNAPVSIVSRGGVLVCTAEKQAPHVAGVTLGLRYSQTTDEASGTACLLPAAGPAHLWSSSCAGTGSHPAAAAATSQCSNSSYHWAALGDSTSQSAERKSWMLRGHLGEWKELERRTQDV